MRREWLICALMVLAFIGPFLGFVTGFAACFRILHWMEALEERHGK